MREFYQGLIAFRKATPQLHLTSGDDVAEELCFLDTAKLPSVVAFTLKDYLVVYNASKEKILLSAPIAGTYTTYIEGDQASATPLSTCAYRIGEGIPVDGISCLVAHMEG